MMSKEAIAPQAEAEHDFDYNIDAEEKEASVVVDETNSDIEDIVVNETNSDLEDIVVNETNSDLEDIVVHETNSGIDSITLNSANKSMVETKGVVACEFVPTSENPLQNLEEFLNDDEEGGCEEGDDNDEATIQFRGPQTNEEVDELLAKRKKEKRKLKKKLDRKSQNQHNDLQVSNRGNKSAEPSMSKEQIGLIRYSDMAMIHIGEVNNPRIGELPSRTANLPQKQMLHNPEVLVATSAKKLVSKIWNNDSSSSDEDDEEDEEDEEADDKSETKDDEGILGAIREGVGVIKDIVKPMLESKASSYVQLGEPDMEAASKNDTAKKRKKKKKKKAEVVLLPRRPLEAMELEEGKRLREETPLSLRLRSYQAIFSRDTDCCGHGTVVILGFRITQGQMCVGTVCVILLLVYSLTTESIVEDAPLQNVDVGRDMEPESNSQPTYTSRGSYIP